MKKVLGALAVSLAIMTVAGGALARPAPTANEKLVLAFCDLAYNQHKPVEAAQKYMGDTFIQHNPRVPNGPKAFADFFIDFFKKWPQASIDVRKVYVTNDVVILHSNFRTERDKRGYAVVDIFRVAKGKIVEHWDVIEAIPETSANGNSMFYETKSN